MGVKLLVKELVWKCFSLSVSSIFWPILLISSVFLFTLRFFIQKLLNLIHGHGKYTLAQGIDGLFAYEKVSGGSAIIHSLFVIKGYPDFGKIKQRYRDKVFQFVEHPIKKCPSSGETGLYTQRLKKTFVSKFGFAAWKDTSSTFNLNRHVRILDGLGMQDEISEDKVLSMVSRLMDESTLFSNQQPQWEHLIIPNYHVEGSKEPHFACIFRVHHAYADGASFSILIDSVLSDTPIKYAVNPLKPFPGSSFIKDAALHFNAVLFGPLTFLMTLKSAVCDKSSIIIKGDYSNRKHLNWSNPIDMKFLKEVRSASGTSVSSIIMSSFTGALRKLYKERPLDFGPEVPREINIGSMAVMLPYKSRQLQNHFSTFSLPCPLSEPEETKRLQKIDRISKRISYSSEPRFNFFIMRFSGYLPRIVQDMLADLAGTPVLFSNVPGAKAPFSVFGGEVTDAGAWLPLVKTYGMGVGTFSYCDQMRICISTDSKHFLRQSDLKSFIDDVENELKNLGNSFGIKTSPTMNLNASTPSKHLEENIKNPLARRISYAMA